MGAAAAAAALVGWRVEGGGGAPGASVTLAIERSPALAVEPVGILLRRALRPSRGGPARALIVRNATGGTLAVRVLAAGARTDLERLLRLRVRAGGRTLFEGPPARLRAGGSLAFLLSSHEARRVWVTIWIPAGTRSGYESRAASVRLRLATRAAG